MMFSFPVFMHSLDVLCILIHFNDLIVPGLMSFLKQIRNETASTVSCNNNTDKDSSQESQGGVNGIINDLR